MDNKDCSKEELLDELIKLRKRNQELELYIKEKYPSELEGLGTAKPSEKEEGLSESRVGLEKELEDTKLLQSISLELLSEGNIQGRL